MVGSLNLPSGLMRMMFFFRAHKQNVGMVVDFLDAGKFFRQRQRKFAGADTGIADN